MIVERRTYLIWRLIQFWIFFSILILEFVQLLKYRDFYQNPPANEQLRIWICEGISFAIIGYILINFDKRWKNGPFKFDIALDWILFITWSIQSFFSIFNNSLNCKTSSVDDEQARCRLFLVNTTLSFLALFTTIITLILSKSRWNNRELIPSLGRARKLYIIQKGALGNGEPALFFYSKNKKNTPRLRDSISKSSPLSPINISIPEPEIAAIANHTKDKDIPGITVKNENEEDNLVLKY